MQMLLLRSEHPTGRLEVDGLHVAIRSGPIPLRLVAGPTTTFLQTHLRRKFTS
jgi:hypothetical protein